MLLLSFSFSFGGKRRSVGDENFHEKGNKFVTLIVDPSNRCDNCGGEEGLHFRYTVFENNHGSCVLVRSVFMSTLAGNR